MNPYILVFISIILSSLGQIFLKMGANSFMEIRLSTDNLFIIISKMIKNPSIILGVVIFSLSFFIWILSLSKLKLNIAYPLSSATFVLVGVMSALILKEPFSFYQIVGIGLIVFGIIILFQ